MNRCSMQWSIFPNDCPTSLYNVLDWVSLWLVSLSEIRLSTQKTYNSTLVQVIQDYYMLKFGMLTITAHSPRWS